MIDLLIELYGYVVFDFVLWLNGVELVWQVGLFVDYYFVVVGVCGKGVGVVDVICVLYCELVEDMFLVFGLCDFYVENLIWCGDWFLGILDFQDVVVVYLVYDLVLGL